VPESEAQPKHISMFLLVKVRCLSCNDCLADFRSWFWVQDCYWQYPGALWVLWTCFSAL